MDLNYSAEETAFRDQVRAWLEENLPHDLRDKVVNYEALEKDDLLRWHRILAAKGWVAPNWPEEWGGTKWTAVERHIFEEECGYAGCPPLARFARAITTSSRARRSGRRWRTSPTGSSASCEPTGAGTSVRRASRSF